MSQTELVREFLLKINKFVQYLNNAPVRIDNFAINCVLSKINKVKTQFRNAESRLAVIAADREKILKNEEGVVYVFQKNVLKAILSKTIEKPTIVEVEKLEECCNCQFRDSFNFLPGRQPVLINTESELINVDSYLSVVALEVFYHKYRTYDPFTCFIGIYKQNGEIYVIDVLKFKHLIPKLNLLKCGVQKILHCEKCVQILHSEFGSIGCYVNFSEPSCDMFVDYRIRPINQIFLDLMAESLSETVNKINLNMTFNKEEYNNSEITTEEKFEIFIDKNIGIQNTPYLEKMFILRDFLARKYNESPEYVLNDKQMLMLLEMSPNSIEQLSRLVSYMSETLRLHATDFLNILRKKSDFSIEKLKKKELNSQVTDEYVETREARMPFFVKPKTDKDDNSSFEISDVEE